MEQVLCVLKKLGDEEREAVGDLDRLAKELLEQLPEGAKNALIELMEEALTVVREPSEAVLDLVDSAYTALDAEREVEIVKVSEIGSDKDFIAWLPLLSEEEEEEEEVKKEEMNATKFAVWCGELNRLEIDVLMHSTTSQGYGCFWPGHSCSEQKLQRLAGPRMRKECVEIMRSRGNEPLTPECPALVTQGYRLAARHVALVAPPRLLSTENECKRKRKIRPRPTDTELEALKSCFRNGLDAAQGLGARSVALPFTFESFPIVAARDIALESVCDWFRANGSKTSIEFVVFVVPQAKAKMYATLAIELVACRVTNRFLRIAQHWLSQEKKQRVLIIAGQPAKEPRPVDAHLFDEDESQNQYSFYRSFPWLSELGYTSHTDCENRLAEDHLVSDDLKRAYLVERSARILTAPPPLAISALKEQLIDKTSIYVYALTADNEFTKCCNTEDEDETSWHFYAGAVGDWSLQQCEIPCSLDAFWDARPEIDDMRPHLPRIPDNKMTVCDSCAAKFLPNVRTIAADAFTHAAHDGHQDEFISWLDADDEDILILELRADDRPTRRFVDSLLEDNPKTKLIRLHPSHYQVPSHFLKDQRALPLGLEFNIEAIDALFNLSSAQSTTKSKKISKTDTGSLSTTRDPSFSRIIHNQDDVYHAAILTEKDDCELLRNLHWRDHLRALRLPPPFLVDERKHAGSSALTTGSTQNATTTAFHSHHHSAL